MASLPEQHDDFEEAEQLAEHGTFWSPRDKEKGHPEKLVLRLERWENKPSKFKPDKERQVFVGRDRDGQLWFVPVDNLDLQPAWTGDVKRWNEERQVFEVVDNWGRTEPGEVVVFEYRGDRTYTNKDGQQVTTGSYRFTRKQPDPTVSGRVEQPPPVSDDEADATAAEQAEKEAETGADDIPF
jgi:hypothetical protein